MIIGLGCRRLRGKSTIAKYLCKWHGFQELSFALALKKAGQVIFGLTDRQLYGDLKTMLDPFWGRTPREILQKLGTEAGRNVFGEDIWIKVVEREIKEYPKCDYVVSDVRFRNEAEAIKSWGGTLVRVDRDIPYDPQQDDHPSERNLDYFTGWDHIIDNNGTIDQLEAKLDKIIRETNDP